MSGLLAIETSSEACSAALSLNGEIRLKAYREPRRHAELLLPAVRKLLSEGGITVGELDAIAFGRGPGSFTSLRIGIGVVQGLAWGAEVGVVPVSSLAALAQGVVEKNVLEPGTLIVTAMDARMGEVFNACYRVGASGLAELTGDEEVTPPESVPIPGSDQFVTVGNGFEHYPELRERLAGHSVSYSDCWPSAAAIVSLAEAWLTENQALPAHQAQPLYIRDDVAKKPGGLS